MLRKRLCLSPIIVKESVFKSSRACCFTEPVKFSTKGQSKSTSKSLSTHGRANSILAVKPRNLLQQDLRTKSLAAEERLHEVLETANAILQTNGIPKEDAVLGSLRACEEYAQHLVDASEGKETVVAKFKDRGTPATNLLHLDEGQEKSGTSSPSTALLAASMKVKAAERISATAYSIISKPAVFITPAILQSYVRTQFLLGRPETLPQAFTLYSNKPVARPGTSPVQYMSPNPKKASSAVSVSVANAALSAGIEAKNLPLCLDIINSTVCSSAYLKSKILRRAMIPLSGLVLAPLAAYTLASQLSAYQDTMDSTTATNVAFAGILAYVGFTATIGMVAITTANDQMDRVTWATGTPLRERWLREEERAMIDRVAGAWGFKESWRRGEEESYDWEALKEWTGLRGMVLDRVELMEGME
ncbi:hypothetical protein MMC06_004717 [Schaereria dolodes]|nr:hypothetical protein [Schaereria dolodes]